MLMKHSCGHRLVTSTLAASREAQLYMLPALAVLSGIGGFTLCHFGLRLLRQKHALLRTSAHELPSAVAGTAEVYGLAQGESTIPSAITGQPCYYYRVVAWQEGSDDTWQRVAEETELIPFCLDDMTGHVQVNPCGAEVDLLRDFHEEYGRATLVTHTDVPESVMAFLARHNISTAKGVRVEEYRISPQSALFVTGTLVKKDASQLAALNLPSAQSSAKNSPVSERGEIPVPAVAEGSCHEVVRLSPQGVARSATAMSMQSRVAAALARAQESNGAIWETSAPVAVAIPQPQPEAAQDQPASMLALGKGEGASPFVISWRTRQESAGTRVWPAVLLALGCLLFFVSSYSLLTGLGWR